MRLGDEARAAIVARAGGDARGALNLLEAAAADTGAGGEIALESVQSAAGGRAVVYDREGDAHYDTISAFIKSLRGSDPDAAVYYLAVMLKGGEDPKFIARRLIVAASEDVGNADPRALEVAVAAARAVEFVGLPEARINLAQATTYIALAPKSNASYRAIGAALDLVEREGARRPPLALRDSSVANARGLGNGTGYQYPHDHPDAVLDGSLLPEGLEGRVFYEPTDRGPEAEMAARLRDLRARLREDEKPFRAPVDAFSAEHLAVIAATAAAAVGAGLLARRDGGHADADRRPRPRRPARAERGGVPRRPPARHGALAAQRPAAAPDGRGDGRRRHRPVVGVAARVRAHLVLGRVGDGAGAADAGPAPVVPGLPLVVVRDRPHRRDRRGGAHGVGDAPHAPARRRPPRLRLEPRRHRARRRRDACCSTATTCTCGGSLGAAACWT